MTISPASAVPSMVTVVLAAGPVTMSSRWEAPTRKKWNRPLWTPTDIRRDTFCPRTVKPSDHPQVAPHVDGGPTGPGLVGLAREQEQQGVAAELEEASPVGHGDVQQGHEAGPDGGCQLFGAHLPVLGQTFGEFGEAGDVDEGHRAQDLPRPHLGRVVEPVDGQPGKVGREGMPSVDGRVRAESSVADHRWATLGWGHVETGGGAPPGASLRSTVPEGDTISCITPGGRRGHVRPLPDGSRQARVAMISSIMARVVSGWRRASLPTGSPSQTVGTTNPIWSFSNRADQDS